MNIKSIAEKAMLVGVHINTPGSSRQNKTFTEKIINEKSLGSQAGRWLSKRFPDEALKPFNNISQESRGPNSLFQKLSLPWNSNGERILPAINFLELTENLRKIKDGKFWPAVEKFGEKYPEYVTWAQDNHKEEFQADDYPDWDVLIKEFNFKVDIGPLPLKEDFRVNMYEDELNKIQSEIDSRLVEAIETSKKEIIQRIAKPITHLLNKLKEKDSIFRDTIVGNIRDIIGLIPSLNLSNDADLNNLKKELESSFNGVVPDKLREDENYRKETADKAEKLIKKLESYY